MNDGITEYSKSRNPFRENNSIIQLIYQPIRTHISFYSFFVYFPSFSLQRGYLTLTALVDAQMVFIYKNWRVAMMNCHPTIIFGNIVDVSTSKLCYSIKNSATSSRRLVVLENGSRFCMINQNLSTQTLTFSQQQCVWCWTLA